MTDTRWTGAGSFVVFGGSGGIGSHVVRELAARGARVVAAARDEDRLAALDVPDDLVRTARCDVTSTDDVTACLKLAADHGGGRVEGIALCVGSILLKPAHLTSDAEWDDVVAKNLTSAFHVTRAAGKTMRKGGSVVFCSTAAAAIGLANHEAIAAAKAGVEGLVRSAAASYAPRGLRFNAVAPGLVATDLASAITSNERALEASTAMHALGRIGQPADVAAAIVWLLDPANDWTTGQILRVDGGLARVRPTPRR